MPSVRHAIQLEIDGPLLKPESVSLGDLAKILESVHKILRYHEGTTEAPSGDHSSPLVSLSGLFESSAGLEMSLSDAGIAALADLTNELGREDHLEGSNLRPQVVAELHKFDHMLSTKKWSAHFLKNDHGVRTVPLQAPQERVLIRGTTTVYGRCVRVGGDPNATARIRPLGDKKLLTARLASTALATELAGKL